MTFATSEAVIDLSLALYSTADRMEPDHEDHLILTVGVQHSDHGRTRWIISRCRPPLWLLEDTALVIVMAVNGVHSRSQHGSEELALA